MALQKSRIKRRFDDLCFGDVRGDDANRILKRLLHHEAFIFTFLDDLAVPPDNNRAEREIRPAVNSSEVPQSGGRLLGFDLRVFLG